jgi:hypothetical protein
MRGRALLVAAGLALASSACVRRTAEVTALRIVVTWMGVDPDQLVFTLALEDGTPLGAPEKRPAEPGGALTTGTAVVVYLGPYRSGQVIRCDVEALTAGRVVAVGTGWGTVVGLQTVEVPVALLNSLGPPPDTGSDGGVATSTPTEGPSGPTDAGVAADAEQPPVVDPPWDAPAPIDDAMVAPPSDLLADVAPDAPLPADVAPDKPPPLKGSGEPCGASSECDSGHCTDGVCCMEECSGPCRSCAGSQPGTCTFTGGGLADPRKLCAAALPSSCGPTGACNGQGGCVYYPAGIMCAPPTCSEGQRFRPASLCDGTGKCVPSDTTNCRPFRCQNSGCYMSCTTSAECCCGSRCEDGRCQ